MIVDVGMNWLSHVSAIGLLAALAYALAWVPMFVFRVETISKALPFYEPVERFTVRLAPLIMTVHVTLACFLLSYQPPTLPRLGAGGALFVGALGFWRWARGLIGPIQTRRLPQEPPLSFRRDGAFAWVRHPLYLSYVIASLAPVVATGSGVLLVTFVACFAVIAVRATQEERRLRDQIGAEYDEYCRRVRRLVPFVW